MAHSLSNDKVLVIGNGDMRGEITLRWATPGGRSLRAILDDPQTFRVAEDDLGRDELREVVIPSEVLMGALQLMMGRRIEIAVEEVGQEVVGKIWDEQG